MAMECVQQAFLSLRVVVNTYDLLLQGPSASAISAFLLLVTAAATIVRTCSFSKCATYIPADNGNRPFKTGFFVFFFQLRYRPR
jgi:hypothetical protein